MHTQRIFPKSKTVTGDIYLRKTAVCTEPTLRGSRLINAFRLYLRIAEIIKPGEPGFIY
jgi:hypothetical protein